MCWLTPPELRKVEDDLAKTARLVRERQDRCLAALHAAALELRGHNECFDECHTIPDGTFGCDEYARESEEAWNVFGQCVEALTEHGISIDVPFEGQKVRR